MVKGPGNWKQETLVVKKSVRALIPKRVQTKRPTLSDMNKPIGYYRKSVAVSQGILKNLILSPFESDTIAILF